MLQTRKQRLREIREFVQSHAGLKGRKQNWNLGLLEAKVHAFNCSAWYLLFAAGPLYMWVLHLQIQTQMDNMKKQKQKQKNKEKSHIVADLCYIGKPTMVVSAMNMYRLFPPVIIP